jgi:adenylylsulfate kinase-like enzyme
VDSPYEPPERPELVLETGRESADALAERVVAYLATAARTQTALRGIAFEKGVAGRGKD